MTEVGFLFDSWRKMGFLEAPGADHRAAETVRAFAGKLDDLEPVASCGGLVGLRPRKTDAKSRASPCEFYICNPSTTGAVHPLGRPRIMDQAHLLLASDGGRCFHLHVLNLDLLRHHKVLQLQTFTCDDKREQWGAVIPTYANLPPSTFLRPSALVLDGVAYFLCRSTALFGYNAYVLPLHLDGSRPPAPIWLPEELTYHRNNMVLKKKQVLLASSAGGRLSLVVARDHTISLWTLTYQGKHLSRWTRSFVVDLRFKDLPPLKGVKVKLECFAEKSGAVLFRMYRGTLFELNLASIKVRYIGSYSSSSPMCAYDMDPPAAVPSQFPRCC